MLALFPTLLPDEPLYSAVARYADEMAVPTEAGLLRAAFGEAQVQPGVELPSHLDAFVARLPPGHRYTLGELIERHTALPYYAAFLPGERVAQIGRAMRAGAARAPITLLGLTTSPVRNPQTFRYCRACAAADEARDGTPYWRRVHQLPGVVVCPEHGAPLYASAINRLGGPRRRRYASLKRALAESAGREMAVDHRLVDLARRVAEDSLWLLRHPTPDPDPEGVRARYREWLAREGWISPSSGRIRVQLLARSVDERYGADVPGRLFAGRTATLRAGARRTGTASWVARITGAKGGAGHPLLHLVLAAYLGESAPRLVARGTDYEPGGVAGGGSSGVSPTRSKAGAPSTASSSAGPAPRRTPCGNPVCPAFDPSGLRELQASEADAGSRTVACPECEYTYCLGVSKLRSGRRRVTVLQTGALWDDTLRALLQVPAVSLRMLVKHLGLDTDSIQYHARRIGCWPAHWGADAAARADRALEHRPVGAVGGGARASTVTRHRTRWDALRAAHPEETRQELRARARATEAFLAEHDREWFEDNLPSGRQPPSAVASWSVDWGERDREVLAHAREAVRAIRSGSGRPTRVTIRTVARHLGLTGALRGWLPNLPDTADFLDAAVETWDQFALRRVAWAAASIAADGTPPGRNVLVRRAGLSNPRARQMDPALDEVVVALRAHHERKTALPPEWALVLAPAPWESKPDAAVRPTLAGTAASVTR